MLLPLARVSRRQGARYFPTAPDSAAQSYWEAPLARGSGVTALDGAPDPAALLALAGQYWAARGDKRLASLVPDLIALRDEMLAAPATAADDGEVSISVYPLF